MDAAAEGYQFGGFSSGSTFFGGNEVITIMRRPRYKLSELHNSSIMAAA
jgi:hypothetical protein